MRSEEIKSLRRKLKKARESGKLQEISDSCCNLAAYLGDEEEHDEALKLYKESLTCCEKLGNKEGVALAHRMIAEECINLGYFEDALKHVNIFLKYAQEEGNKVEEQRGLVLKGQVYFTQAEYLINAKPRESKKVEKLLEQSMEAYRKSYAICNTELHDISEKERLQMKARLLQNKSLVLCRQNKLDFAKAHLIRAIKICTMEKLNDTEHICYLSLGDVFLKKGESQKALNVFNRAFDLSHSTQKKIDSLIGVAKTYIVLENYQQAKITLKKAFKLRADDEIKKLLKHVVSIIRLENNLCSTPDSEHKVRKELYKKLGDSFSALKNYKKSVRCYLNMLSCAQKAELSKTDLIKCYELISKALTNDRQYDKALFYSHQEVESLSRWVPEKACKTYFRIAKLHELNDTEFEDIYAAYLNAKKKAQEFKNYNFQLKCLKKLISITQTFNKFDLLKEFEKELQDLKNRENDSESSCDSGNDSESDVSTDNESATEQSSDDLKDLISDSDVENEEYDRPRERCKRTKFPLKRNEKGETDLHVATIKGNYKRVKHLIDQGHPVNVQDGAGWTPLHEACNYGYLDIVNLLLDFGADINNKGGIACEGTTPLHDAATNGKLEVIETLIKRGASTLVLNDAGETPLQCLLAWKRHTVLDSDEDALFQNVVEILKSPLDLADIQRHIKPSKSLVNIKSVEKVMKKTPNAFESVDIGDSKTKTKPKKAFAVLEDRETIESFRNKRQAGRSESRGSTSSNSDDDCYPSSRKKVKSACEESKKAVEELPTSKKKVQSACEEYKKVIEELRYGPKKFSSAPSQTKKKKPALIREDEYVDNCIMDNDEEEEPDDNGSDNNQVAVTDATDVEDEVSSQPRGENECSPPEPRKPSLEEEMKKKPWLKSIPMDLLEDSFELPSKQFEDDDVFKALPPLDESEFCTQKTSQSPVDPKFNVTVKLFNNTIKIAVDQSEADKLKLDWLIQEISKKDPSLRNPDNYVWFKNEDGRKMESESLAELGSGELECVVVKWKALPLSERYEKVCTITSHPDISQEIRAFGFKHTVHPQVFENLKDFSKTRTLTLSNLKLSSLTLIPICKAIKYETFIQSLDLSNNYFGDKGIELIVKIFEKCILEELNVSGCNVTSTGLYYFSDALNGMNELSKNGLEVLNLSNNPVTDDAVAAINNIIAQLPNLRILNLEKCELETPISVNNSINLLIIQNNKFESRHPRKEIESS